MNTASTLRLRRFSARQPTTLSTKAARIGCLLLVFVYLQACSATGGYESPVSADFSGKKTVSVVGDAQVASWEHGENGPSVVFLHGIPTSSYLWRNVLPVVGEQAQAVAFDLPGYGESSLPQIRQAQDSDPSVRYAYSRLYETTAAWLDARSEDKFFLVVNDLGSVLGIDYAVRNPDRIIGIVMVEAVFMPSEQWRQQLGFIQRTMFKTMRSNFIANQMILTKPRLNSMILSMGVERRLTHREKQQYLMPYKDVERRKVVRFGPGPATFNSDIGKKSAMAKAMDRNASGLVESNFPILLLTADPGFIVNNAAIKYAKANFDNLTIRDVGRAKHYIPEDQPTAVGNAINDWINTIIEEL